MALAGAAVVIILALSIGGYLYFQSHQAIKPVKDIDFVAEVGRLIELPTGENPTIYTIADITKFKDQLFFQKAKNGDKVLIYTNAKKAILYDPQAKKVIDVVPVNIGSPSAQALGPKIVLRNGTKTAGLAAKAETDLKKVVADLNVILKENATGDYDKTVIVVLNSMGLNLAKDLTKILNASQSALPAGESKPKDGDILILLGRDRI